MSQNRINSTKTILQIVTNTITSVVTCSGVIPLDDTIPQITEGTEVLTCSITPISSSSQLLIEYTGHFCVDGTTREVTTALFQDTTANALAAQYSKGTASLAQTGSLRYIMTSGTTSSTTLRIRVGVSAGSAYVNGDSTGTAIMGGTNMTRLTITEII